MVLLLLLLLLVLLLRGDRGGGDFLFSFFLGEAGIEMNWSRVPMVVWLIGLLCQIWYIISYAIAVVRGWLFFFYKGDIF